MTDTPEIAAARAAFRSAEDHCAETCGAAALAAQAVQKLDDEVSRQALKRADKAYADARELRLQAQARLEQAIHDQRRWEECFQGEADQYMDQRAEGRI